MANPANIQRLIVSGYTRPVRTVLMFRIGPAAPTREFLGRWIANTPAGPGETLPGEPVLHFAFSWPGLAHLLNDEGSLDTAEGRRQMDPFFADPTQAPDSAALAEQLGFVGPSSPTRWWSSQFNTASIDLVIVGLFDTVGQKSRCLDDLRTEAVAAGLVELELPDREDNALSGVIPEDGRVHFGYRDGVSGHVVDWNNEAKPGTVSAREFFVGYPNDDYPTSPFRPGPWQDFARDGSYLGLTWLYQDVAAFEAFLRANADDAAPHVNGADPEEWIAAKLMGRWRDGSPLVRHPDRMPASPDLENDFGYGNDRAGLSCPLTSHIRVTNLRDQKMSFANEIRFPKGPPKLIRRGFSYGPPFPGGEDDGVDRGLVGLFACARLNEQFYTVLRWMQKTGFSDDFDQVPRGLNGQDSVIGNRGKSGARTTANIPVPNGQALELNLRDFVHFKGVAALFAPGMHALRMLASDPRA